MISKDPYSWFSSYNNWAKKCNWSDVNHHYIEEYNLFYGKFLEFSLQTNKLVFIRYVDLIADTNSVLEQLKAKMNLKKRLFARLMLRNTDKVAQSSLFTEERRAYYINEKYLEEYSDKELQIINQYIDWHVVSLLGYKKIDVNKIG